MATAAWPGTTKTAAVSNPSRTAWRMYGPIDEAANTDPNPARPESSMRVSAELRATRYERKVSIPSASTHTEISRGERSVRKRSWSSRRATGFMSPALRRSAPPVPALAPAWDRR